MASRNKSSILWIDGQQFTFNALVEHAKKQARERSGEFWIKAAIVLLKRVFELEKEAQTLRQGELFTPPQLQSKGSVKREL